LRDHQVTAGGKIGGQDPADADADGPVIRLTGDARFAKVVIHRGRPDPHASSWQQSQHAAISAAVKGSGAS
jgi:hypothetical protein